MMEVLATVAAIAMAILIGVFLFGYLYSLSQPYPEDFPTEEVEEDKETRI